MNGQERFLAALRCEPVDKLPCHWMAIEPAGHFRREFDEYLDLDDNPEFENCFEIGPLGDLTQLNWFSRGTSADMGLHGAGINFPPVFYNPEKDHFYTKKEAESLPASKKNFKISWFGDVKQFGYQLGKEGERDSKYWWFEKHFFSGPDGLEKMEELYDEFGAPWDFEFDPDSPSIASARKSYKLMEEYGFPHAVHGSAPFHFEGIWGGFGPTQIMKLARKKPGKLKDICKKFEKVSLTIEQYHLEAGVKIIGTGDDLGQKERSLVSPKMYEEFFKPALKARCDLAHKYDAVVWMHSCGYIEELLDHFMDAGLDGLQSLEVPAGNNLARIRTKVRDKMCLIGGIDSSRVMSFGTPEECDAHTKEQIKNATTLDGEIMDGGYIPGPAHDLIDIPMVNMQAVIKAIAKYGDIGTLKK